MSKGFTFHFTGTDVSGSTRIEMIGTVLTITVTTHDGSTPERVEITDHAACGGDTDDCLKAAALDCLTMVQEMRASQIMSGWTPCDVTMECNRCDEVHVIAAPVLLPVGAPGGWNLVGSLN